MKLCLTCYRLWPAKATYCGHCGRSFGGRICRTKKAHRSPRDAQFCMECGSADLTDPTPYLSLGCFSHLLTWGAAILLLWLLLPRSGRVVGWLYALTGNRLNVNFNPIVLLDHCLFWLLFLFMWYVLLSALLSMIPGEAGKQLNRLVFGSIGLLLKLLSDGIALIFQGMRQILRLLFSFAGGNKP